MNVTHLPGQKGVTMVKSNDLHKMITSVQDQHMTPVEESKEPYIGLFYVVDGNLYWDGIPAKYAQGNIAYKIFPKMHPTYWEETVIKADVMLKEFDAYHFPRGRVVYDINKRQYELVADQCILSNNKMLSDIITEFHLPKNNLIFSNDSHYRCAVCKALRTSNVQSTETN